MRPRCDPLQRRADSQQRRFIAIRRDELHADRYAVPVPVQRDGRRRVARRIERCRERDRANDIAPLRFAVITRRREQTERQWRHWHGGREQEIEVDEETRHEAAEGVNAIEGGDVVGAGAAVVAGHAEIVRLHVVFGHGAVEDGFQQLYRLAGVAVDDLHVRIEHPLGNGKSGIFDCKAESPAMRDRRVDGREAIRVGFGVEPRLADDCDLHAGDIAADFLDERSFRRLRPVRRSDVGACRAVEQERAVSHGPRHRVRGREAGPALPDIGTDGIAGAGYKQNIASLTISTTCLRGAADGEYLDGPNATPCVISADPTTATTPSLDAVNVNTTGAAEGGSTVVVTGEGGFAFASRVAFYDGEGTGAAFDACGGTARTASFPQVDGKPDKAGPVTGDVGTMATTMGNYHLCATMAAANAERIELGAYTADVNLVAAEGGRPFLPLSASDLSVGTIKHDGTTVRIPFLSSFENYTQRLVIVNRNKADVGYTLRFHMEGSMGTVDPMEVEGVAMAGVTTVVKVADVVTFTNPTRGSGTLEIVSNPRMVDVATTMINKMDQSSDTVILHLGKRDLNNIGP